jgi:hypothetical protein
VKRLWPFLTGLAATAAFLAPGAATAAAPQTCTSTGVVFTTSTGDVTVAGPTTHFQNSGVGGSFTSGLLSGYTLTGAQNIQRNDVTGRLAVEGSYVATGPDGTVTVHYAGVLDLTTGLATGHFTTTGGTGAFAGFHWSGDISGHLVSLTPPTTVATNSGFCQPA